MKLIDTDVVIIGAGPAGSSSALIAAKCGANVVLVERRPVVGLPVQCAEYIPALLVGKLNMGRSFVVQPVRGMQTFLPDGTTRETKAPGYNIRRDYFDQSLAQTAVDAGVRLMLATRAISLTPDKQVIVKAHTGDISRINARVIIGADGPRSKIARWIGSANPCLIPAVQARVGLARPLELNEVYLSRDLFAGYGWLFPKDQRANVGLGMNPRGNGSVSLRKRLELFISQRVADDKLVKEIDHYTAGWIPVGPVRRTRCENVILVGDAAGHTHPITGAGIFSAVTCGRMAGKWAARAAIEDDLGYLESYEAEWRDLFGETLDRGYRRRQLMENNWDRFDDIIKSCWIAYREYYEGSN